MLKLTTIMIIQVINMPDSVPSTIVIWSKQLRYIVNNTIPIL